MSNPLPEGSLVRVNGLWHFMELLKVLNLICTISIAFAHSYSYIFIIHRKHNQKFGLLAYFAIQSSEVFNFVFFLHILLVVF